MTLVTTICGVQGWCKTCRPYTKRYVQCPSVTKSLFSSPKISTLISFTFGQKHSSSTDTSTIRMVNITCNETSSCRTSSSLWLFNIVFYITSLCSTPSRITNIKFYTVSIRK